MSSLIIKATNKKNLTFGGKGSWFRSGPERFRIGRASDALYAFDTAKGLACLAPGAVIYLSDSIHTLRTERTLHD